MPELATECLATLYSVAELREREVLDGLVEKAQYGWRCTAPLPFDEDQPCDYLNVPMLHGRSNDTPCGNCGAARPRHEI